MKLLYAFIFIIFLSVIIYSYSKYTTDFQFMAQVKKPVKQNQQAKQQTKQQTKQQAKGNCSSNQYWNGNKCVNKPQSGQGSRNTRKPVSGSTRKPSTNKKPNSGTTRKNGNGTKKPSGSSTTKKPSSKGCPSGQVKVGDTCVKGYQAKDGKCKKGDGLFQGNCFKQADVSEYIRRRRWGIEGGGSGSYVQPGIPVNTTINGKQVEIMSLGDGNAMYVDPKKGPIFGTIDAHGGNFDASSTQSQGSRRFVPLLLAAGALGIAGVAAAISYTQKKLKEYNQPLLSQEQINQAFGASKGSGKIPKNDVSRLGLKPGQTYNYQGKQYTLYQNGDSYTVGVMQCKGKCPNNVYGEQATALGNIATPWAIVGNVPVPGITKDDMKPGTVYTTKDGKNYKVNSDGKGFSQCKASSSGSLRALEYRGGMGGDILQACGTRGRPANNLINDAIHNLSPIVVSPMTTAQNYLQANPQATYSQYQIIAMTSGSPVSEAQFNQLRAQMNLPPTYQGAEQPTQHHSVINSATQTYLQQNPGATYEEYKKKYGNGALSRAEFNAIRTPIVNSVAQNYIQQNPQATYEDYKKKYGSGLSRDEFNLMHTNSIREQNGLPPVYPPLGSQPLTYSQMQEHDYAINSFVEPLYSSLYGNNPVNIPQSTLNSLNSIQTWLQQHPPPLQQGQGIRQWMQNFLTNNQSSLGNLGSSSNRTNTDLARMMANYIYHNIGPLEGTYWTYNNLNNVRAQFSAIYETMNPTHQNGNILNLL